VYLLGVCVLHGQADSFAQWLDNKKEREKNKNLLLIQGAATNLQQLFMVCTTPSCISPQKNVLFSLKADCCCHLYMSNLLIFQVLQELKSK
jgi:hypothetical protein